jgi:hypothetical protein
VNESDKHSIWHPSPKNDLKMIVGSFVRNFRNKLKSVCPWQAFPAYSNKHSGLLRKFVNYGQKMYNIGGRMQK